MTAQMEAPRCPNHEDGSKPRHVQSLPTVVFDPRIGMPGRPTMAGTRMSATGIAEGVLHLGLKTWCRDWDYPPAFALVACWWAGAYGPRPLRRELAEWASEAGNHLWYGCIAVANPPTRVVA